MANIRIVPIVPFDDGGKDGDTLEDAHDYLLRAE